MILLNIWHQIIYIWHKITKLIPQRGFQTTPSSLYLFGSSRCSGMIDEMAQTMAVTQSVFPNQACLKGFSLFRILNPFRFCSPVVPQHMRESWFPQHGKLVPWGHYYGPIPMGCPAGCPIPCIWDVLIVHEQFWFRCVFGTAAFLPYISVLQ